MTTNLVTEIPSYFVGNDEYRVMVFPYPAENEVDFEVYSKATDSYLFTITSNRPDLSTSVLWKYLKGIPTDAVTFSTLFGN